MMPISFLRAPEGKPGMNDASIWNLSCHLITMEGVGGGGSLECELHEHFLFLSLFIFDSAT